MPASSSGCLLVHQGGQIAAVVQNHVQRLPVREQQRLLDAPLVLLVRFALPGVDRNARFRDRRRRMVLGGELVAAAPLHLRTQLDQRLDQHGRLDGHVQAAGNVGRLGAAWTARTSGGSPSDRASRSRPA